jgi:hypothetical protein
MNFDNFIRPFMGKGGWHCMKSILLLCLKRHGYVKKKSMIFDLKNGLFPTIKHSGKFIPKMVVGK